MWEKQPEGKAIPDKFICVAPFNSTTIWRVYPGAAKEKKSNTQMQGKMLWQMCCQIPWKEQTVNNLLLFELFFQQQSTRTKMPPEM